VVQVVDAHQDVRVMFNRNVMRVHRNWSTAIHDAGLHSVLAYHPLSLKKVPSQVLRGLSSRTAVNVWQACAIKKGYKGRSSENRGFLAWAADGEFAFASNAAAAELDALRETRRAIYERAVRPDLELSGTKITEGNMMARSVSRSRTTKAGCRSRPPKP